MYRHLGGALLELFLVLAPRAQQTDDDDQVVQRHRWRHNHKCVYMCTQTQYNTIYNIYIHVHIYVYIYIYTYIHMYLCIYTYSYIQIHTDRYPSIHPYTVDDGVFAADVAGHFGGALYERIYIYI